jgi:hypothetical protein
MDWGKHMKKVLLGLAMVGLLAVFGAAGTAFAAGGAQQNNDPVGKAFTFWGANDVGLPIGLPPTTLYAPSSYHDVVTPDGSETEVFKGQDMANNTGGSVVYTAGVSPVPANQTCLSFVTGHETSDWSLTISASGNWTLTCHFAV